MLTYGKLRVRGATNQPAADSKPASAHEKLNVASLSHAHEATLKEEEEEVLTCGVADSEGRTKPACLLNAESAHKQSNVAKSLTHSSSIF